MKRLMLLAVGSITAVFVACSDDGASPVGDHVDVVVEAGADVMSPDAGPLTGTVAVRVVAFNDFHGNLEPPSGSSSAVIVRGDDPFLQTLDGGATDAGNGNVQVRDRAGGASYLATHIKNLRAGHANSIVVSAGDLTGASPLTSNIFHDEPSIRAVDSMGLAFNGVGNHEFDRGQTELLRLQNGGCHPDGCQPGETWTGAKFHYLAANVNEANQQTLFRPYEIATFEGEKIAFIGMTLEGTAGIVAAQGIQGLSFADEADTVKKYLPEIQKEGASSIVVLVHQGAVPVAGTAYDGCGAEKDPFADLVKAMPPEVDVVVSAHTHQPYICNIGSTLVTSAASYGRVLTTIDLEIDRTTHKVVKKEAKNIVVDRTVAKDSDVEAIVQKYVASSAVVGNEVIGHIGGDLPIVPNTAGETVVGDVIADAQLAASSSAGAVVAFQNIGGIRSDFVYDAPSTGAVTFKSAFTVQPFGNTLTVMDLTGQDIKDALEQQFAAGKATIMQVSSSLSYTWSTSAPAGSHVDAASIKINGTAIVLTQTYRVVVNNFMEGGGDGLSAFTRGKNKVTSSSDIDALLNYFKAHDPLTPPTLNRITNIP